MAACVEAKRLAAGLFAEVGHHKEDAAGRRRLFVVMEADPRSKANLKIVLALTLVHFTGDFYSSFVTPLIPVYVEAFSLSLAQAGLITGLSRLLAFVVPYQGVYSWRTASGSGLHSLERRFPFFLSSPDLCLYRFDRLRNVPPFHGGDGCNLFGQASRTFDVGVQHGGNRGLRPRPDVHRTVCR